MRVGKLTLAAAVVAGLAGAAQAAPLTVNLVLNGTPLVPILDNGPYDTDATVGSIVTSHTQLGAQLAGTGVLFFFSVSTSNSPGTGLAGLIQRRELLVENTSASTPLSMMLTVSDTGFTLPGGPGAPVRLSSSQGGTFAFADPGVDGVSFTSYFNGLGTDLSTLPGTVPAGTLAAPTLSYTTVAPPPFQFTQDYSGTSSAFGTRVASSYSLGNVTWATLSPGAQGNLGGTTALTVIPEPTTMSLLLAPAALLMRRRSR